MVEVRDLRGWSRLPGWLQCKCLAEIQSTLDRQEDHSDAVAEVTSIVSDAGLSHVSMDVRIIHAPTTVKVEICHSKKLATFVNPAVSSGRT